MDEFSIGHGEWRDSKPYGSKIEDFIIEYPEWVVYLRKDIRFKCPDHYSDETETYQSFGTVDCACWGLGVAVTGSIVPCRFSRGRNAEINEGSGEERDHPGFLDHFREVIHFPRGVYPQINDFVLACEWNSRAQRISKDIPKPRPLRIHAAYSIRLTNAYFQREVSHISCGVESHSIQTNHFNSLLIQKLANLPVMNTQQSWNQIDYWKD